LPGKNKRSVTYLPELEERKKKKNGVRRKEAITKKVSLPFQRRL